MARKTVPMDDRSPVGVPSFLIHGLFRSSKWDFSHHVVPPISSSSTYRLESASRGADGFCGYAVPEEQPMRRQPIFIYDRLDEPTRAMLEEHLAAAEGAEMAVCFATGMAAISAAIGMLVQSGDQVIAHKTLYGCTYSLLSNWLPRWQVDVQYLNLKDTEKLAETITPKTRVVYLETPVNPNLEILDLEAICGIVRAANENRPEGEKIRVIVDNTFATPYCQRPLEWGVDLVVHSMTKNLCGFGTDMGGAVVGGKNFESGLLLFRKDFGGALGSKHAWPILVYGLPTLEIRLRRQQETALEIARFLEERPEVTQVFYPGLDSFPQGQLARRQMRDWRGRFAPGNMIYFFVDESSDPGRGDALVDRLADKAYTLTLAVSLGQVRSLIEKPDTMTHAVVPGETQGGENIPLSGIRISVGIEDPEDIIEDLLCAFEKTN